MTSNMWVRYQNHFLKRCKLEFIHEISLKKLKKSQILLLINFNVI